ncbi:hypothetical protein [Paenisporosarcina indica]|uniref:hypothetical protein n=1 Tax=Paenisporosarcina indica TaxID=650093 RepID=UPI00094FE639|nr:hypothetical protein [Paenisporosarcina indica]
MNIFRLSFTFIVGFILATFLFFLDLQLWVIILTMFIFFLAFVVLPQIFTAYRSNNIKSIEKFLKANKKNPLFAYPLATAGGNHVEMEESLRAILAKHKQPYMQNVYHTILALHLDKIETANTYAQKIDKEPLKSYYAAFIAAKKGDFEEASRHEENVSVEWMLHALHALYAHEKGQHSVFETEAQKAIDESRGVQKFILVHSFKNM